MATTAAVAMPAAVVEAATYTALPGDSVLSGVDWATGPSGTAYWLAEGQKFYWLASDGEIWEYGEGIFKAAESLTRSAPQNL